MQDQNAAEIFGPMMTFVWGVLAAAVLLLVVWRVQKSRRRRQRREAARQSQRQLHAWRHGDGEPPAAPQADRPPSRAPDSRA
jgi:type II secretory pathway pseudopilin PulG